MALELCGPRGGEAMQINDNVASLIGHVYDTALDSTLWLDNMEELCRLMECHLGGIWIADDVTREGLLDISWNEPPGSVEAMYEHYIHVAPAAFFGSDLRAGDIFSCEGCYDPAEFRKSEIYNGYYK